MIPSEDNHNKNMLLAKIRLDFREEVQPRFFFRGKSGERAAEEKREQEAALLRNVPFQGIIIEDLDLSPEVYSILDESLDHQVFYAPLMITLRATSVEDLIRFVVKDEFRKIDIIQPQEFSMNSQGLERFMFRISEEIKLHRLNWENKLARR